MNDLEEFLASAGSAPRLVSGVREVPNVPEPRQPNIIYDIGDNVQYRILPNGQFSGSSATLSKLPSGVYRPLWNENLGVILDRMNPITDDIVRLPDSTSDKVLTSIQTFWERKEAFRKRKQLFKRGLLLWGPPGGGKTVCINLLITDLIKRGGLVLYITNPQLGEKALSLVRKIETERPIICVIEDIDELLREYSEHAMLSLLDGENQVQDVCHIATTNYPELLPSRLINRPSRFDEIIKVGLPNKDARRVYLESRIQPNELSQHEFSKWVDETEGLTIAHLRELVISVFCLGVGYYEVLKRLKAMAQKIKNDEGYSSQLGFGK